MGIEKKEVEASELEDAAHKVSGRVAVLSTAMQQEFYNEISIRYSEYVEYLKQTDEYDLEVEALDLQAETKSSRVVKMGKGGQSKFGDDSILETVMANVLRKPFTRKELENLITESLQGKDAQSQQVEITEDYKTFNAQKLEEDLAVNHQHYENLIKELSEDKKLKRVLEKEGEEAYNKALQDKTKELQEAEVVSEQKIRRTFSNRQQYLESIFDFFYVSKNLNYPVSSFDQSEQLIPAVFLGFIIDKRKKNPYLPSALRLRFAIASSNKYLAIPASYMKDVNAIKGASVGVQDKGREDTLARWQAAIKESNVDRKMRHIITGNLLQAFSSYKGKLVSYTTNDGSVKKGILMPEHWSPGNETQQKTDVPILRALKVIRSLTTGQQVTTSNSISIFHQPDGYKLITSSSRSRSGDIFLDPDLLQLVENKNFEKVSDKMVAAIREKNLEELVTILQDRFNVSLSLKPEQYDLIKNDLPKRQSVKPKPIVKLPEQKPEPKSDILELEAEALEMELELLEFAD